MLEILFKILLGFVCGYVIDVLLVWITKWHINAIGFIGAFVYGGVIGIMELSVISPWPIWFVVIISIVAFVISQDFVMREAEHFFRKNE